MPYVRTTVTLDADTELAVRRRMKEQKVSFKQALNDAIRDGVGRRRHESFSTAPASMGRPTVNLDRALQLAGELEDAELLLRMQSGS
jgi:hypothetical protein